MNSSSLTQSNYYSSAFNAAIFDGPIRLYFTQYQEAVALKIYFQLQERLKHLYREGKNFHRYLGEHIFIMLYPSKETFQLSFPHKKAESVCQDRLGTDYVVGVSATLPDESFDFIYSRVVHIIKGWQLKALPSPEIN